MDVQPTLFDLRPVVAVQHDKDDDLDTRFRRWLAANPHVLDLFVELATQLQRAGRHHYGAKAIVEEMRWLYATQTTGSVFKLDNNMTSRLARAAVARQPVLTAMFEFRELRS
jgi:hypothetical protein